MRVIGFELSVPARRRRSPSGACEVQAGGMSLATIGIQLVLQAARPEMTRGLNTDRDQDQAGGWEKRRNQQRPRRNAQRGHREATEHKKPGRQPGRVVWGGGGGAKMHPVQWWGGRPVAD